MRGPEIPPLHPQRQAGAPILRGFPVLFNVTGTLISVYFTIFRVVLLKRIDL